MERNSVVRAIADVTIEECEPKDDSNEWVNMPKSVRDAVMESVIAQTWDTLRLASPFGG